MNNAITLYDSIVFFNSVLYISVSFVSTVTIPYDSKLTCDNFWCSSLSFVSSVTTPYDRKVSFDSASYSSVSLISNVITPHDGVAPVVILDKHNYYKCGCPEEYKCFAESGNFKNFTC